jgi:excisionase family DNA binding protein
MQDYLTAKECAELLGCSLSMVYKLVSGGKLAFYKVGKLHRISRASVLDFINKNLHPAVETKREMAPQPSPQKNKVKNAGVIPLQGKRYLR